MSVPAWRTLGLALALGCHGWSSPPAAPAPAAPAPVEAPAAAVAAARADAGLAYEVWTSVPATPQTPLPTVIALHGLGDDPVRFVHFLQGYAAPVRVLAPKAPLPWSSGTSWFSSRAMQADPERMADELRARADDVVHWLDTVSTTYAFAGKPVVTGFSQGGMLSFALAIHHPDRFAGAVPVAGWLPRPAVPDHATAAQAAIPVRALHGDADDVLPLTGTRRAVDAMRAAGFDVSLEVFEGVPHAVPPAVRARMEAEVGALLAAQGPAGDAAR